MAQSRFAAQLSGQWNQKVLEQEATMKARRREGAEEEKGDEMAAKAQPAETAAAEHEKVAKPEGALSSDSAAADGQGRRRREWREGGERSSPRGDRKAVKNSR